MHISSSAGRVPGLDTGEETDEAGVVVAAEACAEAPGTEERKTEALGKKPPGKKPPTTEPPGRGPRGTETGAIKHENITVFLHQTIIACFHSSTP